MNNQASIHHRQRFSNEFNTQFLISIAFDGIFSTVVNVVPSLRKNPQFFFWNFDPLNGEKAGFNALTFDLSNDENPVLVPFFEP